jgi:tRNA(fMet)-specific endonuclease VapC
MSLLYLLDTNIVSEPTKEEASANVIQKLQKHQFEIAISASVYYELLTGTRRLPNSRRREKLQIYLDNFISTLPVLPYDDSAADWQAAENARLTNDGQTPAFIDAQIAAVAATNRLILVTRNITDFERFSNLELENWFDT